MNEPSEKLSIVFKLLIHPTKSMVFFFCIPVQQLIKSSKDKCRLEVKIVDRKNQEFQFVDARERESFCQHIKQMKMLHSQYTEVTLIRVFVGTWNMGETLKYYIY